MEEPRSSSEPLVERHLRWGWWTLGLFLSLGIALEAMHGFKIGWYLSVANETRRLLWRLAHAHGTLLGIVHIAFALTLRGSHEARRVWRRLSSAALIGSTVLLPGGFLLGGITIHGGDPNQGILLVPVGAALLLFAVVLTALRVRPD